jgi:hypothetical protein
MLDCRPSGWDQSGHLTASVEYARAMAAGPVAFAKTLRRAPSWYPPFYHLVLATVFAVFGVFSWAPAAVNCLFAGVLLYATWELGKKVYPDDNVVAFTGTALTATSPLLAYVSHEALLDYALVALVALAVLAASRESPFTCPSAAASAGAAVATALLVKPTAALFLTVPLLAAVARAAVWKEAAGRRCLIVFLACAGLPPLAWYSLHMQDLNHLFRTNLADAAREGDPALFTWESAAYYLRGLYRIYFAPILVFALLPGVLRALRRWQETRYLWAWIVPAWLALTFLVANKDYRYPLPVLPGVALLGAGGLLWLPRGRLRVGAAALALGLASLYYASLYGPSAGPAWRLTQRGLLAHPSVVFHIPADAFPRCEDWKQDEIVGVLAGALHQRPRPHVAVGVTASLHELSPSGIRYRLVLSRLRADVVDFAYIEDWYEVLGRVDFLIAKTGHQGLEHVTRSSQAINAYVESRPDVFKIILTVPLPDGSEGRLYERLAVLGLAPNTKNTPTEPSRTGEDRDHPTPQ